MYSLLMSSPSERKKLEVNVKNLMRIMIFDSGSPIDCLLFKGFDFEGALESLSVAMSLFGSLRIETHAHILTYSFLINRSDIKSDFNLRNY